MGMPLIKRFFRDTNASTAIEYAMIGALIAVVIVAAVRAVGVNLQAKFFGPISNNIT
jgi:pilus assembly protein Flp/PilA